MVCLHSTRPKKETFHVFKQLRRISCWKWLICLLLLILWNHIGKYIVFERVLPRTIEHSHSGLILDTPVCKVPKFDPFDETVKHLIKDKGSYDCKGDPVFMFAMPNSTIFLNDTILSTAYNTSSKNLSCFYNSIHRVRKPHEYQENSFTFGDTKELKFGVPLNEEFLKIHCQLKTKNFTQYIPLVPLKPEVEKRASEVQVNSKDSLNVILLGIDSVSKLNFLRHFKKTHKFLTSNLTAFEMKGYTKVGDNTFPNLVPLLTGHFVEHYFNDSIRKNMFFDHLDFIWSIYSKNGYRTLYAEDSPETGTFNYFKKGFENPPTDYYFRPIALAMDHSDLRNKSVKHCFNNQLETNIIYGYLKDFVITLKNKRYFAFTMVSTLTHDYLNKASYADEPTYDLLKELWVNDVMNHSIVVLFSDHGIRFGEIRETYIGKFEERMPFMYIILPKWFLEKHKSILKSFETNQNRLITLFDIHATLYNLLDITKPLAEVSKSTITPNGLSLLDEIPKYRTCEMAKILPHWCPCQVYEYISSNNETVIKAASAVVNDINNQLKLFQNVCAHLEVDEITDARLAQANNTVMRFMETNIKKDLKYKNISLNGTNAEVDKLNTLSNFLVTLKTSPGEGMFEGTVQHNVKTETFKVLGISRINMYGNQSICIENPSLKKFCFCK